MLEAHDRGRNTVQQHNCNLLAIGTTKHNIVVLSLICSYRADAGGEKMDQLVTGDEGGENTLLSFTPRSLQKYNIIFHTKVIPVTKI